MRQVRAALGAVVVVIAVGLGGTLAGCAAKRVEVEEPEKAEKAEKAEKRTEKKRKRSGAGTGAGERVIDVIEGKAVWYGGKHHGGPTASGERFDKHAMTAAHRTLKFGTRVRVTNLVNGKSVIVRITDRGPFGKDKTRIIDVSEGAAKKLDFLKRGVVPVRLEILE